jgi:hypothetical protein
MKKDVPLLPYGHRFYSVSMAMSFQDFCHEYAGLDGHVVRKGKVVGVDEETARWFASIKSVHFTLMAKAFDAGVEACQQTHCEE